MDLEYKMTNNYFIQIDGEKVKAEGETLEQLLADKAEFAAIEATKQALAAKKEAAKAKLEALGLDADDLKALGL
jgi:hypothetical protein